MKLTPIIEKVLSSNEKARNSDNELIIGVLQQLGAFLTPSQQEVIRSTNLESIRRTRQKLQEKGKYKPSEAVAKTRRIKSYIVQQNAPQASAQRIEDVVRVLPWGGGL